MADYSFVTLWRFRAPLEPVWDSIYHSEDWPAWWRGVESVERVEGGDDRGIGTLQRYTWRSRLPYRLAFHMRLTRVEPLSLIEGEAVGELTGTGRWRLTHDEGVTHVRYDWDVRTTRPWMNLLAPVARPVFAYTHDVVMRWGGEGLARRLDCKLLAAG